MCWSVDVLEIFFNVKFIFMSKIDKFEDLKCWQASRELVKLAYTSSEQGKLKNDRDTKSQFKRAALSTMNNIAEGFGRFNRKDFIRFLDYSQSSAIEVKSMLYVFEDLEYLDPKIIEELRSKTNDVINLTLGFIKYLRKNV